MYVEASSGSNEPSLSDLHVTQILCVALLNPFEFS